MTRRFYRATLPTIVWNPKEDRALAEFVNGQFSTEDDEVAQKLLALGYPEVGLEDATPPHIIPAPIKDVGDVPIMSGQMTEAGAAKKIQRDGIMAKEKQEAADAGPDTPAGAGPAATEPPEKPEKKAKKSSEKKKKAPEKKKKKAKSKRSIKRRK